jgi:F0F1-type ATP synthase membrane subunit c/vacuolar-type H+-ATPase subunit K
MFAGHILVEIFGSFIVQGLNAGGGGIAVSILAFLFVAFINVLELLVAAIQAYVFGSFLQSALRNPAAADGQQGRLFIGFAAAELLGLMAFAVAMIILYAI